MGASALIENWTNRLLFEGRARANLPAWQSGNALEENTQSDFMSRYLRARPDITYQAATPQNASPNQRDWWSRNFGNVYGEYEAETAKNPYLQFSQFLPKWDWLQKYYGQSPQQRGEGSRQFAPPTQFMY